MATYEEFKASVAAERGRLEQLLSDPFRLPIDQRALWEISDRLDAEAARLVRELNGADMDRKRGIDRVVEIGLYQHPDWDADVLERIEQHIGYRREHAGETRYLLDGAWLAEKGVAAVAAELLVNPSVPAAHRRFLSEMKAVGGKPSERGISAKQILYIEKILREARTSAEQERAGYVTSGMHLAGEWIKTTAQILVRYATTGSATQGPVTPEMLWKYKQKYRKEDGSVDSARVAEEVRLATFRRMPFDTAGRHLDVWLGKISQETHIPDPYLRGAEPKPKS